VWFVKKNLTLSIDADLLDKARVLASMRRTSVNAIIRRLLAEEVGDEGRDAHRAEWSAFFKSVDARVTEAQRALPGGLPSKAVLHDEDQRERGLL
jgi:hypothetical protein